MTLELSAAVFGQGCVLGLRKNKFMSGLTNGKTNNVIKHGKENGFILIVHFLLLGSVVIKWISEYFR